jgi:hypothetical protein
MSTGSHEDQIADQIGRIASRIIRARGTTRVMRAVAKNVLVDWAGESRIKRMMVSPFVKLFSGKTKDEKPAAPTTIAADAGKLITALAAAVNEERAGKPARDKAHRGDAIRDFIVNTDFGEVREMVEGSEEDVLKTIEAFNEHLWKYPAKVGTLVAILIAVLNTSIKSSREVLRPIEKDIGPDLLADIILSTIKGIDGKDTAQLANTVMEITRRLHTGSLLLGKGGRPLFQIYLTDHLKDCFHEIDPELVRKMRIILAEDREAVAAAVSEALTDNPRILSAYLSSIGSVKNSAIRARSRTLRTVEEIGEEGLQAAISETMSDLDTYEIAELVNTACRVLNRIHDVKPDIVRTLVSGVADSMNHEDMEKTARWLIPDLVEATKPLAAAVMPVLIQGLTEMLRPAGGFESAEHEEAIKNLKAALTA